MRVRYVWIILATACCQLTVITPRTKAGPTTAPASAATDWEKAGALHSWGDVSWSSDGNITQIGDIAIELHFDKPPTATSAETEGVVTFKLDCQTENRGTHAVVIFATPGMEGADFQIPRCAPIAEGSNNIGTMLKITKFNDYPGNYDFHITIKPGYNFSAGIGDFDIFDSGATHHLFGKVKVFGVKFDNPNKDPLVMKVEGDHYVYVSGSGTATMPDGKQVKLGS